MSYRLAIYDADTGVFDRYIYPYEEFFEVQSWTLSPGGNCLEALINGDARALNIAPLSLVEIQVLQGPTYQKWYIGRTAKDGNTEAYDPTQFKLIGLYDALNHSICTAEIIFAGDIADQAYAAVFAATDLVTGVAPFILLNTINFPDTTFTGGDIAPKRAAVGEILEALKQSLQLNTFEWGVNYARQAFFRIPANIQVINAADLLEIEHREGDNDGVITEVEIDFGETSALGRITSADTPPITSAPPSYKGKVHAQKHFTLNDDPPIPGTAYVGVLPLDLIWFDKQNALTFVSAFNAAVHSGSSLDIFDENNQTAWVLESNPEGITVGGVPDTKLFYIRISLATPAKVDGFYINMTRGVRWCWAMSSKARGPASNDYTEFQTAGSIPWQTDGGFFWAPMEEATAGKYLQLAIMVDMTPIVDTAAVAPDLLPHLSIYELYFIKSNRALEEAARSFFVEPKQVPSRLIVNGLFTPSANVQFPLRDGGTITLPTKSWQYAMTRQDYRITVIDLEQAGDAEDVAAAAIAREREVRVSQQAIQSVRKDGALSAQSVMWDRIQNVPRNLFPQDAGGGGGGGTTGLRFIVDAGGTDVDPGDGQIRWNNANQNLATRLFIDDLTADGLNLDTFFGHMPNAGYIYLEQVGTPTKQQIWKWTAMPGDGLGYWKFDALRLAYGSALDDGAGVIAWFFPMGITGGTGIGGGDETGWEQITNALWVLNKAGANYANWVETFGPTNFQVSGGVNGSTGHSWRINNQPETNSLRVRMKMKWSGNPAFTPEIGFMIGSRAGYHGWGVLIDPTRVVFIQDETERTYFNFATATDQEFWVDVATNGTTIYAKAYLAGASPPAGWMNQQSLAPNLVAGRIGVFWRSPFTTLGEWLVIEKKVYP